MLYASLHLRRAIGVSSGFRSFRWSTSTALSYSLNTIVVEVGVLDPPADVEAGVPCGGWVDPGDENTACCPLETCDPEGAAEKLGLLVDWWVEDGWKTARSLVSIWDTSVVTSVVTSVSTCCASIGAAALILAIKLVAGIGDKLCVLCASWNSAKDLSFCTISSRMSFRRCRSSRTSILSMSSASLGGVEDMIARKLKNYFVLLTSIRDILG